jgi:hypothetical protein
MPEREIAPSGKGIVVGTERSEVRGQPTGVRASTGLEPGLIATPGYPGLLARVRRGWEYFVSGFRRNS